MSLKRSQLVFASLLVLLAAQARADNSASQQLDALFEREWAFRLQEFPELATYVGDKRYNDRLSSVTPQDQARRAEFWRAVLSDLQGIDPAELGQEQRINYQLFQRQIANNIADVEFLDYQIPILVDEGFHTSFSRLPNSMPFASVADYENYISRLLAWPKHVDQHIANMRAGLARGMSQPKVILQGYEAGLSAHLVDDVQASLFWAPFRSMPAVIAEPEQARLRKRGEQAIRQGVIPGYAAFLTFMRDEYIPGTRESLGAYDMPNGEAYYAYKIRYYTTLDLSAAEIHQIGLQEVARIRAEMDAVIKQVGFKGSYKEFLQFLRTDPRFYAKTADELLMRAAWIAKTMDGKLPALFKTLPRQPYTVNPVPEHMAPTYTAGRYVPPPEGGTQPGQYWVNTYNLKSRPLYTLTALTLHEAVPGHHLQGALAREQSAQPDFRQFDYISAYGEGWGLYSEFLGIESGMYEDPYDNFGRLTYEMWRACRLVIDTGIHAQGWSREQALDYMSDNTALSLHEVTTEIDRYISWPGQALAYKLGELKIRELRRLAEQRLGEEFDLREFHDTILANGSVPLDVLQQSMERYIARKLEGN